MSLGKALAPKVLGMEAEVATFDGEVSFVSHFEKHILFSFMRNTPRLKSVSKPVRVFLRPPSDKKDGKVKELCFLGLLPVIFIRLVKKDAEMKMFLINSFRFLKKNILSP